MALGPTQPEGPPPAPPPTPPPVTPPTPPNPWGTAPTDGNWQKWWTANVGTNTPSLAYLQSLEPLVAGSGVKINRNASGQINGKITLPTGQIVDAVRAFGTQDPTQMAWQWDTGSGGGGGPLPPFAPPKPGTMPALPTFTPPTFKQPTIDEALNSPGYQFRLGQGKNALETWSAAKGTLNDSGTAKALIDYGQNAASQEYQNVWNRDYNAFGSNYKSWADTVLDPQMKQWVSDYSHTEHANDLDYQHYWDRFKYGAGNYTGLGG